MQHYLEALENANDVLKVCIERCRPGNYSNVADLPILNAKQLKETEDKVQSSQKRVRDLEAWQISHEKDVNGLNAQVKHLQGALAEAHVQARNSNMNLVRGGTPPAPAAAKEAVLVSHNEIVKILRAFLETPGSRRYYPTLEYLFT